MVSMIALISFLWKMSYRIVYIPSLYYREIVHTDETNDSGEQIVKVRQKKMKESTFTLSPKIGQADLQVSAHQPFIRMFHVCLFHIQ